MSHKRSRAAYEADLPAERSPFVVFGTPLPPTDDYLRDDGSYVPLHKQEVRDEQGRRRLHGAFTGGWSAGFYNTVGSKEGWTPSTFVSSRSARHKNNPEAKAQRPEDFMDDEDHQAALDDEKLQISDAFIAGTTGGAEASGNGLPGLISYGNDSLGLGLLKRMGWRDGQGIGPKVRRPARLHDTETPVTSLVHGSHLFAPEDVAVVSFVRKVDQHGLGYQSMSSRQFHEPAGPVCRMKEDDKLDAAASRVMGASHFPMAGKSDNTRSQGGIGMGILNDNGSDEDDVYQMAPRVSFATALAGTRKKKKKKQLSSAVSANPALGSKPAFKSQHLISRRRDGRLCRDGAVPLPGFVLARISDSSESFSFSTTFHPPSVPQGWTSSRRGLSEAVQAPDSAPTVPPSATTGHDPRSRALALGEAPLPGKSIFDFISIAARERLVAASGRTNLPPAGGEVPQVQSINDGRESGGHQKLPLLDKETAIIAIGRGKGALGPYADDEAKQSRFRAYLEHAAGLTPEYPTKPESLNWREFAREQEEFYGCARLFKPMTGIMATRFTTSTRTHLSSTLKDTVESGTRKSSDVSQPQDPVEQAARLGLYGQVTRSEQEFFPTRLLCKRFNVRPPDHVTVGSASTTISSTADYESPSSAQLGNDRAPRVEHIEASSSPAPAGPLINTGTSLQTGSRLASTRFPSNNAANKKPSEDVFRAIFGEDSDNE